MATTTQCKTSGKVDPGPMKPKKMTETRERTQRSANRFKTYTNLTTAQSGFQKGASQQRGGRMTHDEKPTFEGTDTQQFGVNKSKQNLK